MKRSLKPLLLFGIALIAVQGLLAQSIPTLELPLITTVTNNGLGASTNPVIVQYRNDAVNNGTFSTYTPTSTLSVSFANQQFTGLNYGTPNYGGNPGLSTVQTTGLVFGIAPSFANDPSPTGGFPYNRYDKIGVYGGPGGPSNPMFTSNPTATGAQLGTGINVATGTNANGGVEIFTTAQALYGNPAYPIGSRVYFGDVVLKFSQPVKNPVIHVAGLGCSYRYLPFGSADIPANYLSTFATTELELVNTGVTSTIMSGNAFLSLSGNNIINTNHSNPNGGSVFDPTETFNNFGAASGSIRINGTVQEITYRVYLQGGTASQFAWSVPGTAILGPGAPRDPFTGDIWYVSASYDKPTQQISGNVFLDKDGLSDNNVNQSAGLPNAKTNVTNSLRANLILGGLVVGTMPVTTEGNFLFDNVLPGLYSVQLTTIAGTIGLPAPATVLPAGWVNTGEFIGSGAGNDGSVNGNSSLVTVAIGEVKSEVNFGIERVPDSKPFNTQIQSPLLGTIITLNSPLLPILTGSDPEDQPTEGILTGKTIKITGLPANSTLRYGGVPINADQTITNFNPASLTILFNIMTTTQHSDFYYAYVDAAGIPDPTPALYRVFWSGGPLVISLSEFTATKNSCTANLNWKTSSEVNGDRFEVEVSTNSNAVYSTVGTVMAAGNSSTTRSYQYSYLMQPGVTYFFRLKMIDKDGSFKNSDIRSLNCSTVKGIVIAPNPVITRFTITGMENGKNIVAVYAANGQLVKTQAIAQSQGEVNISNLAPGFYTVKVTSETGNTVINKIVKY